MRFAALVGLAVWRALDFPNPLEKSIRPFVEGRLFRFREPLSRSRRNCFGVHRLEPASVNMARTVCGSSRPSLWIIRSCASFSARQAALALFSFDRELGRSWFAPQRRSQQLESRKLKSQSEIS